MHIGIVAGEASGDILGAGLMRALKQHYPNAHFSGIGGRAMLAEGMNSLFPLETLSVMGIVEVLKHLPRLLNCRNQLCKHFLDNPPAVFIGIDAPDFNLNLEQMLRETGIKTVHYVSPTVWAWREGRLKKIVKACDLMLTLFPFEAQYYRDHQVRVKFVGHPLADNLALNPIAESPQHAEPARVQVRQQLGIAGYKTVIALLPGSRRQEIQQLAPLFLQTAQQLIEQHGDNLHFIMPLAHPRFKAQIDEYQQLLKCELPITLLDGQAQHAMLAADVVLVASGTATLEAMLCKRPMVVAYRMATLTYWLAKWLVRLPHFSLPNLLARRELVPEFLQHEATAQNLAKAVNYWLDNPEQVLVLQHQFYDLHAQLKRGASEEAARAIVGLLRGH